MTDDTDAASHPMQRDMTVTVVVPTRNSARTLAACLRSLQDQSYSCRVVVVDNASTDATGAIAAAWADELLHAGSERSAQRNIGARRYPADVVGFIDSDMVLDPHVVEEAVAAIAAGAGAVIVPERTVGEGYWTQVRAFERSFYDGADGIEAARFYRSDVFTETGGFDEVLTGCEDIDLTIEARRIAPVVRIRARIDHDEGHLGYVVACRKKAYYAEGVRRYLAKRGVAMLPAAFDRPWLRRPKALLSPQGVGLLALKAGEVMAVGSNLEGSGWVADAPDQTALAAPAPRLTVQADPGVSR